MKPQILNNLTGVENMHAGTLRLAAYLDNSTVVEVSCHPLATLRELEVTLRLWSSVEDSVRGWTQPCGKERGTGHELSLSPRTERFNIVRP